jgi:hypothetical protein
MQSALLEMVVCGGLHEVATFGVFLHAFSGRSEPDCRRLDRYSHLASASQGSRGQDRGSPEAKGQKVAFPSLAAHTRTSGKIGSNLRHDGSQVHWAQAPTARAGGRRREINSILPNSYKAQPRIAIAKGDGERDTTDVSPDDDSVRTVIFCVKPAKGGERRWLQSARSTGEDAAVGGEPLTGVIGAVVGSEEERGGGNLFRLAPAQHRNAGNERHL